MNTDNRHPTSDNSFSCYADRVLPLVEDALDRYTTGIDGCPDVLRDAMRYSLLAPGKRLRPMLVLMATEACGGTVERAIPAAGAVEMVHAYSLIHDDLPAMDNDDLRRGRPTCHIRFDEATAILAGDALLALAFETLATRIQPAGLAGQCCAELAIAAGAGQLVGGQTDDMAELGTGVTVEQLETIHRRKTGAMIRVSLVLGGMLAGMSDDDRRALQQYGDAIGLAFQVTDDLLDVEGDEAMMGKRLQKDAEHAKATYPVLLGVEESRQRARRLIDEACESIGRFGEPGRPLGDLARFILERKH